MRFCLIFLTSVLLLAEGLSGATILFSVTPLGQSSGSGAAGLNSYKLTYAIQDVSFLAHQELDIRFDPALYVSLSNPVAPAGFNLLLEQPNNPPGTFGDYSAMALVDVGAPAGTFSVDVLANARPVIQNFYVYQLDQNDNLVSIVASGTTVNADVPEPSTSLALLICGAILFGRYRYSRRTIQPAAAVRHMQSQF